MINIFKLCWNGNEKLINLLNGLKNLVLDSNFNQELTNLPSTFNVGEIRIRRYDSFYNNCEKVKMFYEAIL